MFFDQYSFELKETLDHINREEIQKLFNEIEAARQNGNRVFVLGNGGSAAAASHWVCDFGKGINVLDSKRLKILAPSDCSSIFSAYGNDDGYNQSFVEQLKNMLEENDLVISLSVSGNSSNLLESHKYAKEVGAKTICIVGDYQGKLIDLSDFAMVIQSKNYGIVEDIHIILEHSISQAMKQDIQKQYA